MKALLLVDLQNDFLPGGSLAVPDGQEIIAVANRLIPSYELVVATQDWHPRVHRSFAAQHPGKRVGDVIELDGLEQILWPEHCVQGTPGAELCSALNSDGIHRIVRKGIDPALDSYSGFFDNGHRRSTGLDDLLHSRDVSQLHVMGLATDYCVKYTVLDALELGFGTHLLLQGVRGVELNPGDSERAIERMVAAGAEIML